jgi:hypothetical protein
MPTVCRLIALCFFALGHMMACANVKLPPCTPESRYLDQCIGQRQYAQEISYVGVFVQDRPDGTGVMTWRDGVSFAGVFSRGRPTTDGLYRNQSGVPITGLDRRNVDLIRMGKLDFSSGNSYEGEFRNGKPHGSGTYIYRDGTRFSGQFVDGVRTGLGTEYDRAGVIVRSGEWRLDELVRSDLKASTSAVVMPTAPLETVQPSRLERRVALVIGNAGYKVNPLINPGNDATDVAASLRNLGFDTTLELNATNIRMKEATRAFADKVKSSDVALIFYAGHGLEVKGRNYLIPVNADIKHEYELEDQAFDAGRWLDMLESIKPDREKRVQIVILDACRDNAFSRSWRSASRGLARMDAPTGTFIAFSTAPGKVASDGDRQRNSPFTKSLLRAIQMPNVPIELTFKEVRRLVIEDTNSAQVPWDNSSLVGDFAFRRTR